MDLFACENLSGERHQLVHAECHFSSPTMQNDNLNHLMDSKHTHTHYHSTVHLFVMWLFRVCLCLRCGWTGRLCDLCLLLLKSVDHSHFRCIFFRNSRNGNATNVIWIPQHNVVVHFKLSTGRNAIPLFPCVAASAGPWSANMLLDFPNV